MSTWHNTTFLRFQDADTFFQAVCPIFALDDYHFSGEAPTIGNDEAQLLQYGKSHQSKIWAFAWIPTRTAWTVVKSCPFELLCEYPRNTLRPRLAELTMLLRCAAIHVNLYGSAFIHAVESDYAGNCCITGGTYEEMDRYNDLDLVVPEQGAGRPMAGLFYNSKAPFLLNPQFNKGLELAYPGRNEMTFEFGEALTGLPCDQWDNCVQVGYLMRGLLPPANGSRVWYFLKR